MTTTAAPARRARSLAVHRARSQDGALKALRWMSVGDWHPDDMDPRPAAEERWTLSAMQDSAQSHRDRLAEAAWFADHDRPHVAGALRRGLARDRDTIAAVLAALARLLDETPTSPDGTATDVQIDATPPPCEALVDALAVAPGAPAQGVTAASRV